MVKPRGNKGKNKEAAAGAATPPAAAPAAPAVKPTESKGKKKKAPAAIRAAPSPAPTVKPMKSKEKNKEAHTAAAGAAAPVEAPVETPVGMPVPSALNLNSSKKIQKPMWRENRSKDAIHLAGGDSAPRRKAKNEKAKEEGPGFIFMCSWRTRQECFRHGVFGMPMSRAELVKMIKPEMRLFLYNIGQKLLYGVFRASSEGGMNLVPEAFGGCFPAQVQKLVALFQSISAAPQPATLHVENQPIAAPAPLRSTTEPPGPAHIPCAYLPQTEERQASPPSPLPPITEPHRSAHTPPAYLPQLESIHVPPSAPSPLTTGPYRSAHLPPAYLPQLESRHIPSATPLSPTTEPYSSAHIPPAYFAQLESRHVPSSAPLPSTTEPYRSAHIPPASLPPPENQCRPSTHQAPIHLPPSDDQYLSRRHLASHLPPYADPYIGRAPAADSNYISTHIPTTENDLHYPTTYAHAADPYYPPPSSSIYRLSEAARAFFPENPNTDPPPPSSIYRPPEAVRAYVPEKPVTSDRLGYRVFLETVEDPNALLSRDYQSLHRTDGYVTPQGNQIDSRYPFEHMGSNSRYERLPLSSYRYDPSLYMQGRSSTDAQQRQPSSSVPVSSRYSFAGAAPAHR